MDINALAAYLRVKLDDPRSAGRVGCLVGHGGSGLTSLAEAIGRPEQVVDDAQRLARLPAFDERGLVLIFDDDDDLCPVDDHERWLRALIDGPVPTSFERLGDVPREPLAKLVERTAPDTHPAVVDALLAAGHHRPLDLQVVLERAWVQRRIRRGAILAHPEELEARPCTPQEVVRRAWLLHPLAHRHVVVALGALIDATTRREIRWSDVRAGLEHVGLGASAEVDLSAIGDLLVVTDGVLQPRKRVMTFLRSLADADVYRDVVPAPGALEPVVRRILDATATPRQDASTRSTPPPTGQPAAEQPSALVAPKAVPAAPKPVSPPKRARPPKKPPPSLRAKAPPKRRLYDDLRAEARRNPSRTEKLRLLGRALDEVYVANIPKTERQALERDIAKLEREADPSRSPKPLVPPHSAAAGPTAQELRVERRVFKDLVDLARTEPDRAIKIELFRKARKQAAIAGVSDAELEQLERDISRLAG